MILTTIRNSSVLTLETTIGNINLLAEVKRLGTYEEIKVQAKIADAFGRSIAVLDIRSLIRAKRAAGREEDLSIIPELETLMEAEERE
jgi:hypothetical protein